MKDVIEALLFAKNKGVKLHELKKQTGKNEEEVLEAINKLQADYDSRESGIIIYEDEGYWRMGVKTDLLPKVKKLMPKEFPKSLMETLSVIAWKQPVTQAFVVKIRGNKAYKHIKKLVRKGFVQAKDHKRTLMLNTTKKFSNYFGEEEEKIKEVLEQRIQKDIKTKNISETKREVE